MFTRPEHTVAFTVLHVRVRSFHFLLLYLLCFDYWVIFMFVSIFLTFALSVTLDVCTLYYMVSRYLVYLGFHLPEKTFLDKY